MGCGQQRVDTDARLGVARQSQSARGGERGYRPQQRPKGVSGLWHLYNYDGKYSEIKRRRQIIHRGESAHCHGRQRERTWQRRTDDG